MKSSWVFKEDGTRQCGQGQEVTLDEMKKSLNEIIGEKEIVAQEKRHLPFMYPQVCGGMTGQVNAYKLTPEGYFKLFHGIVGPIGFQTWIWGSPDHKKDTSGNLSTFTSDPGDGYFPLSALQSEDPEKSAAALVNFLSTLNQVGANPTLISELLGRRCRVYNRGDDLTFDLMPQRVNIELESHRINRIWFG